MIRLFHPIMGKEFDFKIAVLQHKDQVYSKKGTGAVIGNEQLRLATKVHTGIWRTCFCLVTETKKTRKYCQG